MLCFDETSISIGKLFLPFNDEMVSLHAPTFLSAAIIVAPSRFNIRQAALPIPLPAPKNKQFRSK